MATTDNNKDNPLADARNQKIELILVKMGLLSEAGLMKGYEAYKKQKPPKKKKLEEVLVDEKIISEFDLVRGRGIKYDIPLVNLSTQRILVNVLRYVSEEDAKNIASSRYMKQNTSYI